MSYKTEIFFQRAVEPISSAAFVSAYISRPILRPTSRLSSVLLDGAALGNKSVLAGLRGGAGEAALDSGRAQGAEDLALGKHGLYVRFLRRVYGVERGRCRRGFVVRW